MNFIFRKPAALQPDVFRDFILNSVDQFYDEDIYEEASNNIANFHLW